MQIRSGTNRTVLLFKDTAVKVPWGLARSPVRGWLANRSEWRQRRRWDACRPRLTFGHVALVMPRAQFTAADCLTDTGDDWEPGTPPGITKLLACRIAIIGERDEAKPSSWGWFGDRWLLIDFDRAWSHDDRGIVGWIYWHRQERLGRKWAKLPQR